MPPKDFELIKTIGKGAFGSVLKVLRKIDNQIYAVKKISILGMKRHELKKTVNEVRLLASLNHPNLVQYYEAFNSKRHLYCVMEFINGGDLDHKINQIKKKRMFFLEKRVMDITHQILKGLHFLHLNKIIHRDIKPANILLEANGNVKITDLNVSIFSKSGFANTQVGTPYYIAPEMWKHFKYNEKVDIWSLGCLIYELCALRRPFVGNSYAELSRKVCKGQFRDIPYRYNKKLNRIIHRCLSLEVSIRPTAGRLLKSYFNYEIHPIEQKQLLPTIIVPLDVNILNQRLPEPSYAKLPKLIKQHVKSTPEIKNPKTKIVKPFTPEIKSRYNNNIKKRYTPEKVKYTSKNSVKKIDAPVYQSPYVKQKYQSPYVKQRYQSPYRKNDEIRFKNIPDKYNQVPKRYQAKPKNYLTPIKDEEKKIHQIRINKCNNWMKQKKKIYDVRNQKLRNRY